jgi:HlyD family secretion protein
MWKRLLLCCIVLLSACKDKPLRYNGYFDADLTYLSSDFPGRLSHLDVKRGQSVRRDQLLFKLEQTNEHYSVQNSELTQRNLEAQRQGILAQLIYNDINYRRTRQIRTQDAASQNDLDLATEQLAILKSQLAALDSQLQSSQVDTADRKWMLSRKMSVAPDDGIIFDTYYTQDEFVQGGQPILALITRHNIKVIFFVNEEELTRIHIQQKVSISSDGNAKLAVGQISYIANIAQYTPPIIYSREQRSKLVFRVEARIDKPDLNKIHLGQPVSIEFSS